MARKRGVDRIDSFDGPYEWLSNFHERPFLLDDREWPTVEHYFQAMKSEDPRQQEWVRAARDAATAKRRGRSVRLRGGWLSRREDVMRAALEAKFNQHPDLAERLIETGSAHLEEGNTWGDSWWGTVEGVGANRLGLLLMELRGQLRSGETERTAEP